MRASHVALFILAFVGPPASFALGLFALRYGSSFWAAIGHLVAFSVLWGLLLAAALVLAVDFVRER